MDDTISQQLSEKTMRELDAAENHRVIHVLGLIPKDINILCHGQMLCFLRFFIRRFTESLPKSEYRRKSQVDDAARSVVRNIEEGFKRTTTGEYLQFIGYSQGSLEGS